MRDPVKVLVLPFAQHWDASSNRLSLRILVVPRDSFILPYVPNDLGSPKFFPNVEFKFDVRLMPSLRNGLPTPQSGAVAQSIVFPPDPSYAAVFKRLVETFGSVINTDPKRARNLADATNPISVRKHLPASYRDATNYTPDGGSMFTTDNTYSCTMKKPRTQRYERLPPRDFKLSWGELIASILRIPDFAAVAGFVRTRDIQISPDALKDGGYVWFELDPQTAAMIGVSDSTSIKTFAARIPALTGSRDLFTAVLFPVVEPADLGSINYDQISREVEDYTDGWAKAVHCIQPQNVNIVSETPNDARPAKDIGIRIGWDDEQVTVWADRHIDPTKAQFDTFPLGVHGYRVDVLDPSLNRWISLSRAEGDFGVGEITFGQIKSELGVEIHPVSPLDAEDRTYWMSMYFTNWVQSSLVGLDKLALKILGRFKPPPTRPGAIPSKFEHYGLVDPDLQLRYGRKYQFRVRLMDHTGGGPTLDSVPSNLGPSPMPKITFRRWIKPLVPQLVSKMPSIKDEPGSEHDPPIDFIELKRPPMFYPGVMYAGYPNAPSSLEAMADQVAANPPPKSDPVTEPALPDPDVSRIEVTVLLQTLAHDPLAVDGPYMELYTTTRALPADLEASVKVDFEWIDCPDIWNPPKAWIEPNTTALRLPRARTVRLRVNALCRDEPSSADPYFGAEDVRRGPQLIIPLRKNATTETNLFAKNAESHTINGLFLQPALDTVSQLATALGLGNKGTALTAPPAKRVVFACASSIMHVIGPDRGSLTFASHSSLALQWIIVIRLIMQRDWSWDGFPVDGISMIRENKDVVVFAPNHNVNHEALKGPMPDRSSTDIVIVDIVDPKPLPGTKPMGMHVAYRIQTKFLGSVASASDAPIELKIDLPVTTPPTQIPQLASAGIAMSPYVRDDGYTRTLPREKMLWLEFASEIEDDQDRYFCRVLKHAPDPLLLGNHPGLPDSEEPPIPLDPEPMRRIVPDQSPDIAGLATMQPLIPTSSPKHWGMPLPPGLTEASLELLGFWTYEFRVGHWNDKDTVRWSTAQGRFGAPLRVSGMQHPPPQLTCSLNRDGDLIRVSAPFAKPVLDGTVLSVNLPGTQIWFLLYAQAAQTDGAAEKRNILIGRTRGSVGEGAKADSFGYFSRKIVNDVLTMYGLKHNTPLSALAVELFKQDDYISDPLGGDLGRQRILRTSCLVPVPCLC